jgi:hypothetical protein
MSVFSVVTRRGMRLPRALCALPAAALIAGVLGHTAIAGATTVSSNSSIGGTVPGTLGLTVTTPTALGPFVPGVATAYTTTMAATITSTAGATALTAVDSSASAQPGHLVNSSFPAYFLPSALQASAAGGSGSTTGLQSLSGSAATLLNYSAPVTGDFETVTFSQAIGATDALRTGAYSASITLTLTATTP